MNIKYAFILLCIVVLSIGGTAYYLYKAWTLPTLQQVLSEETASIQPILDSFTWKIPDIPFEQRSPALRKIFRNVYMEKSDRRLGRVFCHVFRILVQEDVTCTGTLNDDGTFHIVASSSSGVRAEWDTPHVRESYTTFLRSLFDVLGRHKPRPSGECILSERVKQNTYMPSALLNMEAIDAISTCLKKNPFSSEAFRYLSIGWAHLSESNRRDMEGIQSWEQIMAMVYDVLYRLFTKQDRDLYGHLLLSYIYGNIRPELHLCEEPEDELSGSFCRFLLREPIEEFEVNHPMSRFWEIRRNIELLRRNRVRYHLDLVEDPIRELSSFLHGFEATGYIEARNYGWLLVQLHSKYGKSTFFIDLWRNIVEKEKGEIKDVPLFFLHHEYALKQPKWHSTSRLEKDILKKAWNSMYVQIMYQFFHEIYEHLSAREEGRRIARYFLRSYPSTCEARVAYFLSLTSFEERRKLSKFMLETLKGCTRGYTALVVLGNLPVQDRLKGLDVLKRVEGFYLPILFMKTKTYDVLNLHGISRHFYRIMLERDPYAKDILRRYYYLTRDMDEINALIERSPKPGYLVLGFLESMNASVFPISLDEKCPVLERYLELNWSGGFVTEETIESIGVCFPVFAKEGSAQKWVKRIREFLSTKSVDIGLGNALALYTIGLVHAGLIDEAMYIGKRISGVGSYLTLLALARLADETGDKDRAQRYFRVMARNYPGSSIFHYSFFLLRNGYLSDFRTFLQEKKDEFEKKLSRMHRHVYAYCSNHAQNEVVNTIKTFLSTIINAGFSEKSIASTRWGFARCLREDGFRLWAEVVQNKLPQNLSQVGFELLIPLLEVKWFLGDADAVEFMERVIRSHPKENYYYTVLTMFRGSYFELVPPFVEMVDSVYSLTRFSPPAHINILYYYVRSCGLLKMNCQVERMLSRLTYKKFAQFLALSYEVLSSGKRFPEGSGNPTEYAFTKALLALQKNDYDAALDWLSITMLTRAFGNLELDDAFNLERWVLLRIPFENPMRFYYSYWQRWDLANY